jgi:hypothetical protein
VAAWLSGLRQVGGRLASAARVRSASPRLQRLGRALSVLHTRRSISRRRRGCSWGFAGSAPSVARSQAMCTSSVMVHPTGRVPHIGLPFGWDNRLVLQAHRVAAIDQGSQRCKTRAQQVADQQHEAADSLVGVRRETELGRYDRNLAELTGELRVALPESKSCSRSYSSRRSISASAQ